MEELRCSCCGEAGGVERAREEVLQTENKKKPIICLSRRLVPPLVSSWEQHWCFKLQHGRCSGAGYLQPQCLKCRLLTLICTRTAAPQTRKSVSLEELTRGTHVFLWGVLAFVPHEYVNNFSSDLEHCSQSQECIDLQQHRPLLLQGRKENVCFTHMLHVARTSRMQMACAF